VEVTETKEKRTGRPKDREEGENALGSEGRKGDSLVEEERRGLS